MSNAAAMESRIQQLLDVTQQKLEEAHDRGMGIVTHKLAERIQILDDARAIANELRIKLWELK